MLSRIFGSRKQRELSITLPAVAAAIFLMSAAARQH